MCFKCQCLWSGNITLLLVPQCLRHTAAITLPYFSHQGRGGPELVGAFHAVAFFFCTLEFVSTSLSLCVYGYTSHRYVFSWDILNLWAFSFQGQAVHVTVCTLDFFTLLLVTHTWSI